MTTIVFAWGSYFDLENNPLRKSLIWTNLQKATFETQYKSEIKNTPIHQRVSP